MKKIFSFLTLLLLTCSMAWAATEIITDPGSNTAFSGTAITGPSTYFAGGTRTINEKTTVKVRCNRTDSSTGNASGFGFAINEGCVVSAVDFQISANSKTGSLDKIVVDGTEISIANVVVNGAAGTSYPISIPTRDSYVTVSLSGLNATQYINLEASGSATQWMIWTEVTYTQTEVITQEITAVSINGANISASDLATLKSTSAVSIDGSALNGIGMIDVTLNSGSTSVTRTNSGNDAVFTFTINGNEEHTVTVTGIKKTYSKLGSVVAYKEDATDAIGQDTKTLSLNGITFEMVADGKTFQYGASTVTIGENVYQPLKLSTGSAVNVTFPVGKVATKVKVYGWSLSGNGSLYSISETNDAEAKKIDGVSDDIYYARNTTNDIYPSVYEYDLDNWESMYFNPGGSASQPFVVMDFVLADAAPVQTYSVTYKANGGVGEDIVDDDASEVAGCTFTFEGKSFVKWNTAADGSGDDVEVGATVNSDLILFAQWAKMMPKAIYSLTDGIGSAVVEATDATVNEGTSLVLSNTSGRIKLTAVSGEQFKNGDDISFSGIIGNTGKKYGVKYGSTTSINSGSLYVAGDSDPLAVTGTLSLAAASNDLYIGRYDGTTTTLTSLVISRPMTVTSEAFAGVKIEGAAAVENTDYSISGTVITLANSYVEAPNVELIDHIVFTDESTNNLRVSVAFGAATEGFFTGTAAVNDITYTVKVPVTTSAVVTYYDDSKKLGEEAVAIGGNPADYADYQSKAHHNFVGWYNNADLADEHRIANMAEVVVSADMNIYGKWTVNAISASIDVEGWVIENTTKSRTALLAAMTAAGISCDGYDNLDTLNNSKDYINYPYLGLKFKKTGAGIDAIIPAGKKVILRVGYMDAAGKVFLNGVETATIEGSSSDVAAEYEFNIAAETLFRFETTSGKTAVLKGIFIDEAPVYYRALGEGKWGTICLPKAVAAAPANAEFYEIVGKAANGSYVELNDVAALEAGKAYLYYSANKSLLIAEMSGDAANTPVANNGLIGVYTETELAASDGAHILSDGQFHLISGEATATIGKNRAYLKLDQVSLAAAPGRVRISLGENTATSMEELGASDEVQKFMQDGKLFIIRNGVVYDAMGKMVK